MLFLGDAQWEFLNVNIFLRELSTMCCKLGDVNTVLFSKLACRGQAFHCHLKLQTAKVFLHILCDQRGWKSPFNLGRSNYQRTFHTLERNRSFTLNHHLHTHLLTSKPAIKAHSSRQTEELLCGQSKSCRP